MAIKITRGRVGTINASSLYEDDIDKEYDFNSAWDLLLSLGVSEETLEIVTSINGANVESLNDIAYAKFGEYLDQL